MINGVTHAHLGPIWYHSELSDVLYSPNQFLGWDFFCRFLQQVSSKTKVVWNPKIPWLLPLMYECSLYVHYRTCNFAQLSLQNMELHRVSYQITSVYNQFAFSKFKLVSVRNIIERVLMICHMGCLIIIYRSFWVLWDCS